VEFKAENYKHHFQFSCYMRNNDVKHDVVNVRWFTPVFRKHKHNGKFCNSKKKI